MTTEIATNECSRCWGSGRLAARNAPGGSVLCPNCSGTGRVKAAAKVAPIVAPTPVRPTPATTPASYRCYRCHVALSAAVAMRGSFGVVCPDCYDREGGN